MIRTFLSRMGVEVISTRTRYQLNSLSRLPMLPILTSYLLQSLKTPPLLVQVGANDGQTDDECFSLIQSGMVKAVLIEPMKEPYLALIELYERRNEVVLVNEAVSYQYSSMRLHHFEDEVEKDRILSVYTSYDYGYLVRKKKELSIKSKILSSSIQASTVKGILKRHQIDQCDILVVDVEGADDLIVSGALEEGLTPSIIQYERINLAPQCQQDLEDRLVNLGYGFSDSARDTIAFQM